MVMAMKVPVLFLPLLMHLFPNPLKLRQFLLLKIIVWLSVALAMYIRGDQIDMGN